MKRSFDPGAAGPTELRSSGPALDRARAIAPERYRHILGHFCTGVTVVTTLSETTPVGFTCQSFSAVSLDPSLVLVCPRTASQSWRSMERAGVFAVNVLGAHQQEISHAFSMVGDRFGGVGWTPGPETGSPILDDVLAWVECAISSAVEAGDHMLIIGRVLDLAADTGEPLLFFRGGYGVLGDGGAGRHKR